MKRILPILLMLFLLTGCHSSKYIPEHTEILIPYQNRNGKFGFINAQGELKIKPQYDDAKPFENGVAIVGKGKNYGLINTKNEVILPLKYASVEMAQYDKSIFISTKKEYNAWWRFWDWRILPGFNILGGNSGPFLLTKVPRAKYEVQTLNKKKKLFSKRKTDHDLGVSYWNKGWEPQHFVPYEYQPRINTKNTLKIGTQFYQKEETGWRRLPRKVKAIVNDSIWLYRSGSSFYPGHPNGEKLSKDRLVRTTSLITKDSKGRAIRVQNKIPDMPPYTVFQKPIYHNSGGKYFLSPQFKQSFPTQIADYQKDTINIPGGKILKSAVQIIPWNQESFLVVSIAGSKEGYKPYFLKSDEGWKTDVPTDGSMVPNHAGNGLTMVDDRIYWLIHPDFSVTKFPGDFIPIWGHPDWYFMKDSDAENYGIYEPKNKKWILEPQYHSLETTADPDVTIYSIEDKNEEGDSRKYGLLNMVTGKRITPPKYFWIEEDGRVRERHNRKSIEFYIDLKTGREFRDKK